MVGADRWILATQRYLTAGKESADGLLLLQVAYCHRKSGFFYSATFRMRAIALKKTACLVNLESGLA